MTRYAGEEVKCTCPASDCQTGKSDSTSSKIAQEKNDVSPRVEKPTVESKVVRAPRTTTNSVDNRMTEEGKRDRRNAEAQKYGAPPPEWAKKLPNPADPRSIRHQQGTKATVPSPPEYYTAEYLENQKRGSTLGYKTKYAAGYRTAELNEKQPNGGIWASYPYQTPIHYQPQQPMGYSSYDHNSNYQQFAPQQSSTPQASSHAPCYRANSSSWYPPSSQY